MAAVLNPFTSFMGFHPPNFYQGFSFNYASPAVATSFFAPQPNPLYPQQAPPAPAPLTRSHQTSVYSQQAPQQQPPPPPPPIYSQSPPAPSYSPPQQAPSTYTAPQQVRSAYTHAQPAVSYSQAQPAASYPQTQPAASYPQAPAYPQVQHAPTCSRAQPALDQQQHVPSCSQSAPRPQATSRSHRVSRTAEQKLASSHRAQRQSTAVEYVDSGSVRRREPRVIREVIMLPTPEPIYRQVRHRMPTPERGVITRTVTKKANGDIVVRQQPPARTTSHSRLSSTPPRHAHRPRNIHTD